MEISLGNLYEDILGGGGGGVGGGGHEGLTLFGEN